MMPSRPGPTLICTDDGQRLQVEHGDGLIAPVGREAVARLAGDACTVYTRRVRNVAEDRAGGAFDHHHVGATRHEHAAGGGLDGDVVGAAVAFDDEVEFFNSECLRR